MDNVLLPAGVELVILTARTVRHEDRPPFPSELVSIFIVFGAGALLSQWDRRVGSLFSWGIVVATLLTDSTFLTPSTATQRRINDPAHNPPVNRPGYKNIPGVIVGNVGGNNERNN